MRFPRSLSTAQNNSLCLLLIYTLAISLLAPFAVKRVKAITPNKVSDVSASKNRPSPVKAPAPVASKPQEQKSKWREGELLVRFHDHAPAQKMNSLLRVNGAQWNGQLRGQSGIERLSLKTGSDPEMVAAQLRSSELIEFAEPNYLITADQATQTAPDDPRFSEQWSLKDTGVAQAWATTTGSKQTVIAVIDSGIDFTHPDLKNNQWDNSLEQDNNLDNDSNGFTSDLHGWDFVANTGGIIDGQGHGTAIAGIIAAEGNNRVGMTGVMWRASLMSLRVLDNTGTGDVAGAIEAIDYATTNGAQVINCSWGTDDSSVALREAVSRAAGRGVVVVASAGNQARDIETTLRYPASFNLPNLISVAATDNSDSLTSFSNWGATHVTIAAPGADILTTKMGGDYQTISGTSASAALVTGVVGLIKTERPWLSADRAREMILRGARPVPSLSDKVASKGIVSAAGVTEAIHNLPPNEGLDESGGNNGGEHGNNGNGRGNQGDSNRPGTDNRGGNDDRHRDGREFRVTPPARMTGAPGLGLPNLDELRRKQPVNPKALDPVPSTRCSHQDPQCTRDKDKDKKKAASQAPDDSPGWPFTIPTATAFNSATVSNSSSAQSSPLALLAWNSKDSLLSHLLDDENPLLSDSVSPIRLFPPTRREAVSLPPDAAPLLQSGLISRNILSLLLAALPQTSNNKIAFASNRDGNAQVYWMNADGSSQTRLTSNGTNDESPKWSPDNSRILFQSDRDNPFSGLMEVYVMNWDGSMQTRLTNDAADDSFPVWSPAGNKIAFQSARNNLYYQVYVMNSDGSNQVNVSNGNTNDGQPSWSPDGTKIAFTSERDHPGVPAIYVMNADGSNQTRLTFSASPSRDEQPAWSPDGTKLLFTSTRDSVVESWQETDDDGGIINRTWVHTNKEVYLMNSTGSNQIRLTNNLENEDSPAWSADGTKIVFRSERERDWIDPVEQVWVMNADGSNQVDLSNSWFGDYSPSWQRLTGNILPTANAGGHYSAASGTAIQISGAGSSDPDGTITGYQWSFGDGTTGTGVSPSHAYSSNGTYTITLTVTDNSGAQSAPSTASITVTDFSTARLDPNNRTGSGGVDLLSGNANWSLPILSLKGRAGLDLGLSLSYNSLVWTKSQDGASIKFDADRGMPSPGFRLGFPVIQPRYYNSQVGANAYLLITPSGDHTELRQVGTSNTYEAADSSYLQLIDGGNGSLTLIPTDGTQLSYSLYSGQYQCTQIKDRNGNFMTINYGSINGIANTGNLTSIVDTLGRTITFNYDAYLNLISITQDWGGVAHPWVNFGWGTVTMQTSFSNSNSGSLTVIGPQNGTIIPVLKQVYFADQSHTSFNYTSWGQVYQIANYGADSVLRNWVGYNLPGSEWLATSAQSDCPRFTEQKEWAGAWNNNQVATTFYSLAGDHSSGQVTMPDGTIYKELFATSGWQKGLTTGTEYWSASVKKKWTATTYTQDDINLSYQKNPRPIESNINDVEGNHKRTTIGYTTFTLPSTTSCSLPSDVSEYSADAATLLRRTHTDYRYDSAYLTRRIIGLVDGVSVYDGAGNMASKVRFDYDWPQYSDLLQATPGTATQHDDTNYGVNFCYGRGNLVWEMRYDVTDPNNTIAGTDSIYKYYTTGSVIYARDPGNHAVNINYTDSFSDATKNSLNTFAYPTAITDAAGNSSTSQYNYDFGAVTRTQSPAPAGQSQGAIQTFEYDGAGRTTKVNNVNNNGYQKWVYDPSGSVSTFSLLQTGGVEAWAVTLYDGMGRMYASGGDNPNSAGGYRGQFTLYDVMGRASQTSNPTEINSSWVPAGDDAAGWVSTYQAYDWKGRPTVTTNPDGTTKQATYGGCGCAGGEVVTVRDEVGRQQRVTADILGRNIKTEVLDYDPSQTVYSTVTNTYNARDQVTSVYQQAGSSGSGQTTSLTYDGHGRLKTQQSPSQTAATTYAYNRDDTVLNVTDGRGAVTNFTYNNRHQATNISYSAPNGIAVPSPVTLAYDAAGNRTSMVDGSGSVTYAYDELSRLTSESRQFSGLTGAFPLSYSYNLVGGLTSVTDPTGAVVNYAYDKTGRMTDVTGSAFGGVTQYASNVQYRAWGAVKGMSSGDSMTTTASFNSRLEPTDFSVSSIISKHYEYNADGRLRYSQDLVNNKFDRSYTYDHVGRVTEAFSGPMARGQADTFNRPYKLSYAYDEMNHLTSGSGRIWSMPHLTDTGSGVYANNKNTAWQYDADGRLTDTGEIQYTHDAAGLATGIVSNGGDVTQTQVFDGSGVRTKLYTNRASTSEIVTQYFVTSSVLGSVVTELDGNGQKTKTLVYGSGQVLAQQNKSGGVESIGWEHRDASNASVRGANAAELDPLGSDAGLINTFQPPHAGHALHEDMTYPGFADAMSGNCRLDGIEAPCTLVNRLMEAGAAGIDYLVHDKNGWRHEQFPIIPLGLGLYVMEVPVVMQDEEGPYFDTEEQFFSHPQETTPRQEIADCHRFAATVDTIANDTIGKEQFPSDVQTFMDRLATTFTEFPRATLSDVRGAQRGGRVNNDYQRFGSSGFASQFFEPDVVTANGHREPSNQVRHSVGGLIAGFVSPIGQTAALNRMNARENPNDREHGIPDINLNGQTVSMGAGLAGSAGRVLAKGLGDWIRNTLCGK